MDMEDTEMETEIDMKIEMERDTETETDNIRMALSGQRDATALFSAVRFTLCDIY
jgi:hypothetical protein